MPLTLDVDGAALAAGAATRELPTLRKLADGLPRDRAGVRLHNIDGLDALIGRTSRIADLIEAYGGRSFFAVRALLFDKSARQNWSLAWHQDRTIVVRRRRKVAGFGPWTTKAGLLHVTPPVSVLDKMITVRIHLDPVPVGNAPLLVAPGSHRLGRVSEADIPGVVERCGMVACLAEAGDVWVYATPILHASEVASDPVRRRVLQVDYARDDLPGELEWLGI